MPVNKNAFRRYQIIDQVIRNRKRASKREIMNQVIAVFGRNYSEKQFYNDINDLKDTNPYGKKEFGWCCPIDQDKDNKYWYTDPEFSLTRITFNTPDRVVIESSRKLLKNLKGFPLFRDLEVILERLSNNINDELPEPTTVRTDPFIEYENRDYKGIEFINSLTTSAALRTRVGIEYYDYFNQKPLKMVFEPYLLKEYRNRWYCIGKLKRTEEFKTVALDRILTLKVLDDEKFDTDKSFSSQEFFKYAYGISTPSNYKPQYQNSWEPCLVKLKFDALQKEYIKSLPLHHSQKILRETKNEMVVSLEVYITIELIKDVRSFGPRVEVLNPKNLLKDYCDFEKSYRPPKSK